MSNPAAISTTGFNLRAWLIARWRMLSVIAGVLLVYALLGFLLVPHLVGKYAPQFVREQLHRQLTLGKVKFNPFTLALRLYQVQLSEANGAVIARIDYLLVNAELSSLFTGSYTFKKIQLDDPSVSLIVAADGHVNLDFSDANAPTPANKSTALPAVRIGELQLNHGKVHVEDLSRPKPFSADFTPIQFTLENFSTQPRYDNAFHFAAKSAADERIDWQGEFTVQPLGSKGKLQVTNLQASTLQNYLQSALPFRLLSGTLGLQGDYQLALNDQTELQLSLASITAKDTQIAPLNTDATGAGDMPWVTLPQLTISNTQVSLRERSVKMQQVQLSKPQLLAWTDANYKLNLLQLLGPDEPSSTPWHTQVDDISVNEATVQYEDRAVTPVAQFKLSPAQLQLQHFSSAPDTSITLNTNLRINDGADFNASGTVNLDTLSSQLKIKLANFSLADVQSYAAASTDMLISSGQLNAEGDAYYKGTANNKNPSIKFNGSVDVTNLSTQDKAEGKDFIKWQSLKLQGMQYSMAPDALIIDHIIAHQPYGRVIIDRDGMTNIQHVLRIKPAAVDKNAEANAKPAAKVGSKSSAPIMKIRIAKTLIENGEADFTDNTVQPIFSTGMQRLNGSIIGLSSAMDSRAKITLHGSVDNRAPVSISGEANFLAAETFSDVSMKIRNMELTTFNPYSGKFAGYSIAKGKLATEIRYQIVNRNLDAQHHIVIDQLEFGAATDSKDAVPLPIKLAAALLKDRNGVIDLNLPVGGSIDDPNFKIGPIIWKACVGLLTKIVTAPFSALGSLFGGSSEELAYVDFAPGSAVLSAAAVDKLGKLAHALVERPQLKLNVPLTVVSDVDAAAMNEAAYASALQSALPNAATATPAQRLTALTSLYQRTANTAAAFPPVSDPKADVTAAHLAYLESIIKPLFAISTADRDALTRARADAVQTALLTNTEVSPERIYLTARSNEAKSPDGVSRMELKLE
jgi:hypothetical protein